MIKTITERSLHEVIQRMRAEGVTLKDTEGFGINMDQSGHTYVVYMGEEDETGVIDVSAGEAGLSSWFNPASTAAAYFDGSSTYTAVEIGVVASAGSEALTNTTGHTWAKTLAHGASPIENYIKPNSFSIAAVDSAPSIIDNGLGVLKTNDSHGRAVGTIDYDTGAVSVTYVAGKAPASGSTVTASYTYSPLPNTSVFPKLVALSHIVFETSEAATVSFSLYNNDPDRVTAANAIPSFFGTTGTSEQYPDGKFVSEFFCDSRISINLNTLISDRKVRWMKMVSNAGYIKAVHVYWNRLST